MEVPEDLCKKTAAVVIIGNEILSGRTQDSNLNCLALFLNNMGIYLREVRVVPDEERAIVSALRELRDMVTYVFTTGGIGPTHDDITSDAVAKSFSVPLRLHPEAKGILEKYYTKDQLTEERLKMARIPEGAQLIRNAVSAAPGFIINNVFVLAGVPRIMQAMLDDLKGHLIGGNKIFSETVTLSVAEGQIASHLSEIQKDHMDITIGSYPFFKSGVVGTSIVFRGENLEQIHRAMGQLKSHCSEKNIIVQA